MLATPLDHLRVRAERLIAGTRCNVIDSDCALGGGTTPTETIPSVAIAISGNASDLYTRFLQNDPPMVGRVVKDRYTIDVRSLIEGDFESVAAALKKG